MRNIFHNRRRPANACALMATASLLAIAAPAHAQTSDAAPSEGQNQEIIVTAQFRSQNLQDTPIAITAMNAEMLEARSQTNITQIAAQAPNVVIQPAPGGYGSAAQVAIRGVGQGDSNLAFEPGVGVYIDDVYYSTLFGNVFDLLDLDRIEVLRGPQGTLAGKNSVGGAIKLFSKKPDGDTDGFIEGTYGSYNLLNIRAGANITLVKDKLFMRVSGTAKRTDGYLKRLDYKCVNPASTLPQQAPTSASCKIGEEGGVRQLGGRVALRFVPDDRLEFNLVGDVFLNDDQPQANKLSYASAVPGYAGPAYLTGAGNYTSYSTYSDPVTGLVLPAKNTLHPWGVSGTIDYTLSDTISLKSITAYRRQSGEFTSDADTSPQAPSSTYYTIRQSQFTQELRLNAEIGSIADFTVGGYYYKGSGVSGGRIAFFPLFDFYSDDRIKSENKSGFAHVVLHPFDGLNVTGGLRYTDESKRYDFNRHMVDGSFSPFVNPINGLSGKFSGQRWDYRVGVDYRWTPEVMTYAQFSTGFKGGGVNARPFYPNQVAAFGPEKVTAYEIGLKSDLLDRRVRINLSAFYNNFDNIQIQTATPYFNVNLPVQPDITLPNYNPAGGTFPSAVYQNVGNARMKGIELETTLKPVEGLLIDGSLSYLDFKYKRLLPQALSSGIAYGMVAPFTPKWKASIGAQYEASLGDAGSLTPRIDWAYQSSSFSDASNSVRNTLGSRSVFNARLTYRAPEKDWEASLAVTNLTKEFYYYSLFDRTTSGYVSGVPARPREWQVSIKRRF
ncbi:MAG: TonB-dependent receptor [Novosphingobium sp.]|nr:TonB-dependent receptor [Novosphingobium sp.]